MIGSLQIIDGVDNASPGLNFALGNFFGSIRIRPYEGGDNCWSKFSFYGPNAFNGVISMQTKSPFQFPGFSAHVKAGERAYRNMELGMLKCLRIKKGKTSLHIEIKPFLHACR